MDLVEPLIDAVLNGEEGLIQLYINIGVSLATVTDQHGRGVLHWSAASESGEHLIPYLLSKGAKLDMQDSEGYTALHVYAIVGRLYGLTTLLNQGADPNIPNYYNQTPLHVALQHNRSETANMLLCFGAKLVAPPTNSSVPVLIQKGDTSSSISSVTNSTSSPSSYPKGHMVSKSLESKSLEANNFDVESEQEKS